MITELLDEEIDEVEGGIVPIVLAAAVACTYMQVKFIQGLTDGIYDAETR